MNPNTEITRDAVEDAVVEDPRFRLAHNSIGLIRNVSQPIAVAGPTAGTAIMASVMAIVTGTPGPLSFLLGIGAGGLLVHVFTSLARRFESAGGTYLLAGVLVGVRTAIVVGLLYAGSLFAASSGISVNVATFSQTLVQETTGASIHWVVFAAITAVLATVLAINHVKRFTGVITVVELAGFIALVALGITVLVSAASNGTNIFAAFSLEGISISQVFLGVVVAFSSFGGFEAGMLLSEETRDSKRTVPRGMWTALLIGGACYTFASWFQYVGFGSVEALAGSPEPMFVLAREHFGPAAANVMVGLVVLAGMAAVSACLGGGGRVLFAMIRDGIAPLSWAQLSRSAHAPYRIVIGGALLGVVIWVICAAMGMPSPDAFGAILTTGGLLQMLIYTIISATAILWFLRIREYVSAVIAGLACAITSYTLYTTVFPSGPSGLGVLPLIAASYLVLVVATLLATPSLARRVARSPYWVRAFGERRAILASRSESKVATGFDDTQT